MTPQNLVNNKRALFIISYKGFQDVEYTTTREALEKAGVKVTVASSSLGKATGKFGQQVEVDLNINEVAVNDYDVIIFIGGPGATEYFDSQVAHNLARQTVKDNKLLAAICIAPEILARVGVLAGRNATVWSSALDRSSIEALKNGGANYLDQETVSDGKIITANGPDAATKFAQAILEQLK